MCVYLQLSYLTLGSSPVYIVGISVKTLYEKDGGRAKDLGQLTTQKLTLLGIIIRYTLPKSA